MANEIALTTANRVEIVESVIQMTLPAVEAITAGAPVRIDTATGKWTNANGSAAGEARAWGIATKTVAAGQPVTAIRKGVMDGWALAGMAWDDPVYLSDTDGRLSTVAGTVSTVLGRVIGVSGTTLGTALDKLFSVEVGG